MANTKWSLLYPDRTIIKNGVAYTDLSMPWVPSDILAAQAVGTTVELEKGDQATETISSNETVDASTLSWWSNVSTTWQAADDVEWGAGLSGLSLSSGTLSPNFAKDEYFYSATIDNSTTSVTVTATPIDAGASISITGNTNLVVGANNVLVSVTKDGSPSRMYNILVTRSAE